MTVTTDEPGPAPDQDEAPQETPCPPLSAAAHPDPEDKRWETLLDRKIPARQAWESGFGIEATRPSGGWPAREQDMPAPPAGSWPATDTAFSRVQAAEIREMLAAASNRAQVFDTAEEARQARPLPPELQAEVERLRLERRSRRYSHRMSDGLEPLPAPAWRRRYDDELGPQDDQESPWEPAQDEPEAEAPARTRKGLVAVLRRLRHIQVPAGPLGRVLAQHDDDERQLEDLQPAAPVMDAVSAVKHYMDAARGSTGG